VEKNDPNHWLSLKRTARFGETDAAGVMHFHQLFRWCHEAWEESLNIYGVPTNEVFPSSTKIKHLPKAALPVVHCQANFRHPIFAGDELIMIINPIKLDCYSFEITTAFAIEEKTVALGLIKHVSIDLETRRRIEIPELIERWIEASCINKGPKSI